MSTILYNRPLFEILLNGDDITASLVNRLQSLTLTENRGMDADELDIILDDCDGLLQIPRRGVKLSVRIGWVNGMVIDKGSFIVDEVEHSGSPDTLSIRGRSADLRESLKVKKERSWHDITIGDMVKQIAGEHKLKPIVSEKLGKWLISHLDQSQESDIAFLTRFAETAGAIVTVKSDRLMFISPGKGISGNGQSLSELRITRLIGDEHRYTVADREAYDGVKAYWRNTQEGEKQEVTAGGTENPKVLRHLFADEQTAKAGAAASWDRVQRGAAEFSITLALGRPDLQVESPAVAVGFKEVINSTQWIVIKVVHQINDQGYTTSLELEVRKNDIDE